MIKDGFLTNWEEFKPWLRENMAIWRSYADDPRFSETERLLILVAAMAGDLAQAEDNLQTERQVIERLASARPGTRIDDARPSDVHALAEAKTSDGVVLVVGLLKPAGNVPCAMSKQTGRVFALGWNELAQMALQKGVQEPFNKIVVPK